MLRQEVVHAVDIEMTQMSFEVVARSGRVTQQSAMIVAARCHLWFGFWVRSCRPFVDIALYSSAACVLHIACVFAEEGVGEKRTPLQASFRVGIFVRVRRGGGAGFAGGGVGEEERGREMCVRETGVRFTFAHSWMCVRDRLVCTSLILHIAARMRPRTRGKVLARTSMGNGQPASSHRSTHPRCVLVL